ncbi:MAG TPA: UrcA family protein [Steroidobacteraceae bacterium]|jgi:UrcA family protein|nr:UrcA family protein [Steroidobacteraceae bacterium]
MTSATQTIGERLRAATTAAAVAACLAIGAAGNVHAATSPTVKVGYADLNLATAQGSQALYGRIVDAARSVCVVADIRDLRAVASANACRQDAIARAVRAVHSPELASLYAAQLSRG